MVLEADTVLLLGSTSPFAEVYEAFKNTGKIHQVDIDLINLVNVMLLDASILGDAGRKKRKQSQSKTQ